MKKQLVIIGAGGQATSLYNIAQAGGMEILTFIDENKTGQVLCGITIQPSIEDFIGRDVSFALAIGHNFARERAYQNLQDKITEDRFPPLIHPAASIGALSVIGPGSAVMPGATVGPNTQLGKFCIVNTNASIDHDSVMEEFSSLAPGAHAGGGVKIGKRSALMMAACVKEKITIGKDVVIGANSFVNKDISEACVAYGTPARSVRLRKTDDPYLD